MSASLLFVSAHRKARACDLAVLAQELGFEVRHAAWDEFLTGDPAAGAQGIVLLASSFPLPTLPPHPVLRAVRRRLSQGVRGFVEASVVFSRPDGVRMTPLDNQRLVVTAPGPLSQGLATGSLLDPHQTLVCSAPLPASTTVAPAWGEGMERADDNGLTTEAAFGLGVLVGTHAVLDPADPALAGATPVVGLVREGTRHWAVSRLRLSQFQADLYAPANRWQTLAVNLLRWVAQQEVAPGAHPAGEPAPTQTVRLPRRGWANPTAWNGLSPRRPSEVSARRAVRRVGQWFRDSGILPAADGSQGVAERFMTDVHPGGHRALDWAVRTDCTMHTVLLFDRLARIGELVPGLEPRLGTNLVTFLLEQGYQDTNVGRATEGFWQWGRGQGGRAYDAAEFPEDIYANDQAWVLLTLCSVAATAQIPGLERRLERTARALLETQGSDGLRERCLRGSELNRVGRKAYHEQPGATPSGHFDGMALAALLAYGLRSGDEAYLAVAKKGLEALAAALLSGHRPELPLSLTSDTAYCLPGLSLAVMHLDSPLCRRALTRLTNDLLKAQHPCGAFLERGNPVEDLARRSGDVGVFTSDADQIADLLYTQPPLALYLPLAAQALDSSRLKRSAGRLLAFLAQVQLRSSRKELDGAWMRAFSIAEWDYFGYNADFKWGPTVTESGWTVALLGTAFCQDLLGTPFLGDLSRASPPTRSSTATPR
ncbi:MAG: hypothetical protein WCG80_06660 [Spirochaetales bacterium]